MRDWSLIAAGLDLRVPAGELERITLVLAALETAFRPLAAAIPPEIEPAVRFECPPEEQP
jgi:hypothetical protein